MIRHKAGGKFIGYSDVEYAVEDSHVYGDPTDGPVGVLLTTAVQPPA